MPEDIERKDRRGDAFGRLGRGERNGDPEENAESEGEDGGAFHESLLVQGMYCTPNEFKKKMNRGTRGQAWFPKLFA